MTALIADREHQYQVFKAKIENSLAEREHVHQVFKAKTENDI